MAWWASLFRRGSKSPRAGDLYRVAFVLYSRDGRRAAEVREFADGQTFLLESEQAEGGPFVVRHEGRMVGPFDSPTLAERFVAATPWFTGKASVSAK